MKRFLFSAQRCESGVTSIEYAIIASLISILIVVGATTIGVNLGAIFINVATGF